MTVRQTSWVKKLFLESESTNLGKVKDCQRENYKRQAQVFISGKMMRGEREDLELILWLFCYCYVILFLLEKHQSNPS